MLRDTDAYLQSHIERQDNGCWFWSGRRNRRGYGVAWTPASRSPQGAHRAAYEAWVGPIPEGMLICHRCDNPPCINPAHLWAGTQSENIEDMWRKRRGFDVRGEGNGRAKLTADDARIIRSLRGIETQESLAKRYGITQGAISRIQSGKAWGHV